MRQIVLDTETTGLSPEGGDRIIEIGCIELKSRQLTDSHFHRYINPERASHPEALEVHGLTEAFLSDKPKFADIASEFCDFIRGAELIIHNASFDVGFLNAELKRLDMPSIETVAAKVTDTLAMARELFPARRNSLDALCDRFQIDKTHRDLHGALIDSALLAEVYLAMTRGQETLGIELLTQDDGIDPGNPSFAIQTEIIVQKATPQELAAHEACLDDIEKKLSKPVLWRRLDSS